MAPTWSSLPVNFMVQFVEGVAKNQVKFPIAMKSLATCHIDSTPSIGWFMDSIWYMAKGYSKVTTGYEFCSAAES